MTIWFVADNPHIDNLYSQDQVLSKKAFFDKEKALEYFNKRYAPLFEKETRMGYSPEELTRHYIGAVFSLELDNPDLDPLY